MSTLTLPRCVKRCIHSGHWYGFSPVCDIRCRFKWKLSANDLLETQRRYNLNATCSGVSGRFLTAQSAWIDCRVTMDCGARTQISGFGSRHLNFLAPAPTSRSFWLRLQNNLVQTKKNIVIFAQLAGPRNYVRGIGTQITGSRLHHLKIFGSGSSRPKLL